MPLTTLDPTPALIVIDLQKGLRGVPSIHPFAEIVERSARLAVAFRARGLPVVLVNATGRAPGRTDAPARISADLPPEWTDVLPELDARADDYRVSKQRWGAFTGTPLEGYLRDRGVTQVVVVGVATSIGVESTARSAHELGFNVVLPVDAMTDLDANAHENSLERIFPRLGETTTTAGLIAALQQRA